MSAYEVSTTHIDALLSAGLFRPWRTHGDLRWFDTESRDEDGYQEGEPWGAGAARWFDEHVHYLNEDTAGEVGAMLLAENRASVNFRYAESEYEEPYVFTAMAGVPDPVAVLKALDCLDYQSCEHMGWLASEARLFCEALRRLAIHHLPGYDEASWEITDRYAFAPQSKTDRTREPRAPRFDLGRIVATPGAVLVMGELGVEPSSLIERHQAGDWGTVPPEDAEANEEALLTGERLLSAYEFEGRSIWAITEGDRSATTLLLAEEY